jgi:UDPglucose 6-dehydrogenase
MKVCVQGLWHLGCVTSAGLASLGNDVTGLDRNSETIKYLNAGRAPLFEPGLDELIQEGIKNKKLKFTSSDAEALSDAEVLWVAFDTPVDDDDKADVDFVLEKIKHSLPFLSKGCIVLISSQLPVGTTKVLEEYALQRFPDAEIEFAYSPENLRLGKALEVFLRPDRIIIGTRNDVPKPTLDKLLLPISSNIEWMLTESAEMTKHAINAFLATSITFINEISAICELVGANAKEVEVGLKSESRIGPKSYLSPGGPFAGGTLARDIHFLTQISRLNELPTPLLSSVKISNDAHKEWVKRKLKECFPHGFAGETIAIWGLTYKPGTDTLRRSLSIELCEWLILQGADLQIFDPAINDMPTYFDRRVKLYTDALSALKDASVLVVGTEWPEFKRCAFDIEALAIPSLKIIDVNRHLEQILQSTKLEYFSIGSIPNTIKGGKDV